MKIEEYDITVEMNNWDDYPVITSKTPEGDMFLLHTPPDGWESVQGFLQAIPPGLRVGLKNPETNLFAQLPPRSLH